MLHPRFCCGVKVTPCRCGLEPAVFHLMRLMYFVTQDILTELLLGFVPHMMLDILSTNLSESLFRRPVAVFDRLRHFYTCADLVEPALVKLSFSLLSCLLLARQQSEHFDSHVVNAEFRNLQIMPRRRRLVLGGWWRLFYDGRLLYTRLRRNLVLSTEGAPFRSRLRFRFFLFISAGGSSA